MLIKQQVARWRENRKKVRGNWKQVSTWVRKQDADYLKIIFQKLAGTVFERDDPATWIIERNAQEYRALVSNWEFRNRPVAQSYGGYTTFAEIDAPQVGAWYHFRPIGGRIRGESRTWVELTPDQADDLKHSMTKTIEDALQSWLVEHNLHGVTHDDTGVVAIHQAHHHGEYTTGPNRYGDILRRDPRLFAESEARIEREVMDEAHAQRMHPTKNPDVIYHNFNSWAPSRCFLVSEHHGDKLYVALGHIKYGGTSPTNAFESIAADLLKTRFANEDPANIVWLDCSREWNGNNVRFSAVTMEVAKDLTFWNPEWSPAEFVPESLQSRMAANILEDDPAESRGYV